MTFRFKQILPYSTPLRRKMSPMVNNVCFFFRRISMMFGFCGLLHCCGIFTSIHVSARRTGTEQLVWSGGCEDTRTDPRVILHISAAAGRFLERPAAWRGTGVEREPPLGFIGLANVTRIILRAPATSYPARSFWPEIKGINSRLQRQNYNLPENVN